MENMCDALEDTPLDPKKKILLNKLLKEHHDLSCDIKWLSLAHDFGKNINFHYNLQSVFNGFEILVVFEDLSHFLDNPPTSLRRVYGFFLRNESSEYHLKAFGWWEEYIDLKKYQKFGSLNDIVIDKTKLHSVPFNFFSRLEEQFSIESIEKKKNDLRGIRKKIEGFMVPLLDDFFPRVLTSLIIDYCL